jgi:transcriptional antiterminator RfaH
MKRWYVAYIQPAAERRAAGHLERQGFEVYLPMCRQIRRHARREETVLRPLFPRYIFVAFNIQVDRWRSINGTIGVSNIICHGERPAALPDGVVDKLRAGELDGGAVPLSQMVLFDPGEKLRILDGAFKGHTGTYQSMTSAERVVLLFDLIGSPVRVTVPIHAVEAA